MAPISTVTVLTINGRRPIIKVTPNTTLMQVLEESCKKYELAAEEYDLKHHNKILDLGTPLRFSGIPNNAVLEMCPAKTKRMDAEVIILLQLENGTRLTGTYVPNDTVWHVIETLCGDDAQSLDSPAIVFARTEILGLEKLKTATLRSLGLTSGRAMFRLLNRTPEQLHRQANVSAPLPRRSPPPPAPKRMQQEEPSPTEAMHNASAEPVAGPSWAADAQEETLAPPRKFMKQDSQEPKKPEIEDMTRVVEEQKKAMEKELEKEILFLGERNALVFNRLASSSQLIEDLPDDFFELTIEDAKLLLRDLKKQRQELEETPLKTAALRKLEENRHQLGLLQKYKNAVLRIYFPDATVLQGAFKPVESGEAVYNFVRSHLEQPDCQFELYTSPPKRTLQLEDRLLEVNCVPATILHFTLSAEAPLQTSSSFLRADLLDQLTSPAAAALAASKSKVNREN